MAPQVANTVQSYRRLFAAVKGLGPSEIRSLGNDVGAFLAPTWPDLLEEIQGIAAGAGQDEAELLAINARTEILGGASDQECSAISVLPEASDSGACIVAQNWDWYNDQEASRVLWTVVEPSGRWFVTLTEAGILAKIGLSSEGLGCCLNLLATTVDGGVSGAPVHILLRLLLQRCNTLTEALVLLSNVPATASSCFDLGYQDAVDGMVVSAELSPGGVELVWPEREGWLIHTNHFLRPLPLGADRYIHERPGTLIRYQYLTRRMRAHGLPFSAEDVKDMLRSHFNAPQAVCCHDVVTNPALGRHGTLASVVMDLRARTMQVTEGSPCDAAYEDVPTPALSWSGFSR
jgi:isopenicillin-N N-acyltransferase-like protein